MKIPFLYLAVFLFLPTYAAFASCEYIVDGLDKKMSDYRAFRDGNQQMESQLVEKRLDCQNRGDRISRNISRAAEGRSCKAFQESAALQKEIASVVDDCASFFRELEEIQTTITQGFEAVRSDLQNGLDEMEKDSLFRQYCGDEIRVARTMVDAFITLEGDLISVRTRANQGNSEYLGLKKTSEALASRSTNAETACASQDSAVAQMPEEGRKSRGVGSGRVPHGRSPSSQSDITGTERNKK